MTSTNFLDYLNKDFFTKALCEFLNCPNIVVESVNLSMGCENGDNYCSIVYRVSVNYKTSTGDVENFIGIVKSMPYEAERAAFKDMLLYKKETDMYFKILPKMEKYLNTTIAPRCYYSTSDPIDTIILQDLKPLGLKLVKRDEPLDELHCTVLMRKLGQFHAASMHLADKYPKAFDDFKLGQFSREIVAHQQVQDFFLDTYNSVVKLVKQWPDFHDIAIKMEALEPSYIQRACDNFDGKECGFKVLNHGDMWSNNIFFQYETKVPVDCVFIDFQGCIYNSPGIDLNYFLNFSPQLSVLQNKREFLLKDHYYNSLKSTCEKLSVRIIPSFDDIQMEIEGREFFGLFTAIGSSLICMDKYASQDISVANVIDKDMGEKFREQACQEQKFQSKIRYLLQRAHTLGLLD